MRRIVSLLILALVLTTAPLVAGAEPSENAMQNQLVGMLEKSRQEKKGITLFLPGQSLAIVVTELHGTEAVEGRNQEFGRVLVRMDQILGAALN